MMNSKQKNFNKANDFYEKHAHLTEENKRGELVFKDTNLSVFYVGSLLLTETKVSILEDYPYLTLDDLKYAKVFYSKKINSKPENLTDRTKENSLNETIQRFREISEKGKDKK